MSSVLFASCITHTSWTCYGHHAVADSYHFRNTISSTVVSSYLLVPQVALPKKEVPPQTQTDHARTLGSAHSVWYSSFPGGLPCLITFCEIRTCYSHVRDCRHALYC